MKEALKLALEALENLINQHYAETTTNDDLEKADNAITAIKEALANHIPDATKMVAQPEHEPDEVDIRSRLYQRIHELETQLALPEQEPTNLERHERNVQQLFGTQQPKEPEQEPVAHVCVFPLRGDEFFPQTRIEWKNGRPVAGPLYTTPPQRKPLTYVDLRRIASQCGLGANEVSAQAQAKVDNFARAIEAAHGIKGDA